MSAGPTLTFGADSFVGRSSTNDPSVSRIRSGMIGACSNTSFGSSADLPVTRTSSGRPSTSP
jgi:hypothetical protein